MQKIKKSFREGFTIRIYCIFLKQWVRKLQRFCLALTGNYRQSVRICHNESAKCLTTLLQSVLV